MATEAELDALIAQRNELGLEYGLVPITKQYPEHLRMFNEVIDFIENSLRQYEYEHVQYAINLMNLAKSLGIDKDSPHWIEPPTLYWTDQ